MDQVTKVKKHLKREQWKRLIQDCQSSGLPVAVWCRQNSICEQTYYRNLRVLRQELCESLPAIVDEPDKPVTFQKLAVQAPLPNTQAAVIIRLPHATLEVAEGTSQQTLQAVLLALQNIC